MHKTDNFSYRLSSKMHQMGFTQESLAERLGCSHSTVSRWLSGSKPRMSAAHNLASVLRTTTSWLLDGGEEKEPVNLKIIEQQERKERTISARQRAFDAGFIDEHKRITGEIEAVLWSFPGNKSKIRQTFKSQIMAYVDELDAWCEENLS